MADDDGTAAMIPNIKLLGFLVLLGLVCGHAGHAGPHARLSAPVASVESFYAFHTSHDMGLGVQTVEARRRWLEPELYDLLLHEVRRSSSPDEAPYINGDPFTDSQEYPTEFEVRETVLQDGRATVTVFFTWRGEGRILREREIRVELRRHGRRWRIANLRYETGPDLLALLRREDPAG